MKFDRIGLVGGLAADRPILTTLVLAFGLTALAALGVPEAGAAGGAAAINDLVIAEIALLFSPLLLATLAPRSLPLRLFFATIFVAGGGLAIWLAPHSVAGLFSAPAIALGAFTGFAAYLFLAGPIFGAAAKFAFIAAAGGVLGMAGALGLLFQQGITVSGGAGAVAATAISGGAIIGAGAIADFAGLFAAGADRRRAAGISARRAVTPLAFGTLAAALAFGLPALQADRLAAPYLGGLAGLSLVLAAIPALMVSAGSLRLRQENEMAAVEENRRRAAFRRFWRPMRNVFPPNASLAFIAIASIAVIAAAFNMPSRMPTAHLLFCVFGAIGGGVLFFSLRAGVFVFFTLIVSVSLTDWLWGAFGGPALIPADQAPALALAGLLFGELAITWRDARSPRLNARETTEAAMTDGLATNTLGVAIAIVGLCAGAAAGVFDGGLAASAYLAMIATIGLLLTPALMTALSHVVRRELA